MKQQIIAMSERGVSRYPNQDAVFSKQLQTAVFLALADGMGGHHAGEVASQLTIETVFHVVSEHPDTFSENATAQISAVLEAAVQEANTAVYQYAQKHDYVMGSTLTCAIVIGKHVVVANVGDSRTYLMRNGKLKQLTVDHSLVEHFVQQGIISEAERYSNSNINIVTRGIGNQPKVEIDMFTYTLQQDDQLFLCSDGVWGAFPENNGIAEYLSLDLAMSQIGKQLIQAAVDAGSNDHMSFVWANLGLI